MKDDPREHWQRVYRATKPAEASWFQPVPERSLELIRLTGIPPGAPILDVGGGSSTLADHLAMAGFQDVTVLDVAPLSLNAAQARLGVTATQVHWITADITEFRPERSYALWHDRAVFHFLVEPRRRQRYLDVLRTTLAAGGHLIVAAFGPEGPARCSGLPVLRYSADQLGALLGPGFSLVQSEVEDHVTPQGHRQQFVYGWWRRTR